jgi:hypothetical protein
LRPLGPGGEVEGVGQVQLAGDQSGAGDGDLLGLDAEVPAVRGIAVSTLGDVGYEPSDRLVHQPVERPGLMRPATPAVCWSTKPALGAQPDPDGGAPPGTPRPAVPAARIG